MRGAGDGSLEGPTGKLSMSARWGRIGVPVKTPPYRSTPNDHENSGQIACVLRHIARTLAAAEELSGDKDQVTAHREAGHHAVEHPVRSIAA